MVQVDALGWSDDLKAGYQPDLDVSLVEVPYKVNIVDALGWSDDLKAGYQPELDVSLVEVPYKVNRTIDRFWT